MERTGRNIHVDRTYKRFICSFLIVLFLPVIVFVYLFLDNYKEIYEEKVIAQAEISLEGDLMELERNLENLQAIASYNSQLSHMQKESILREVRDKEITKTFASEIVTHSYIEEICYYNAAKPNVVYTSEGTYSTRYYAQLFAGVDGDDTLLAQLQDIISCDFIRWNQHFSDSQSGNRPTLQYIVRGDKGSWWIFTLSREKLEDILCQEGSITILLDGEGQQLYPMREESSAAEEIAWEEYGGYSITVVSSLAGFSLVRIISEESLFREVNDWQKYFFFMVGGILLVGGALIMVLTLYHGHPIKELQKYCEEKIPNIPRALSGVEVFRFAMNRMEEQVTLLQEKQKKNQILLQLLYGMECDTERFCNSIKAAGVFTHAENYRVVVAFAGENREGNNGKILMYLEPDPENTYELQTVDLSIQNAVVLIAGIKGSGEEKLYQALLNMMDCMKNHADCRVSVYMGSSYQELQKVHLSYHEAITHSRMAGREQGGIIYCEAVKTADEEFVYPYMELNGLYAALEELDFHKADIVTDVLTGILREQKDNRPVCMSLYYDVLNVYYRAQAKLKPEAAATFLDLELLEIWDYPEAVDMICRIRDQFRAYVEDAGEVKAKKGREKKQDENIISRVMEYIIANQTSSELCTSMVADHFGISVSNLSHQFKAQTGCTISDYITEKKFTYACDLLLNTETSVQRIADMTGYSNTANFARRFKQYYGMTPVEYREKNQGKENQEK